MPDKEQKGQTDFMGTEQINIGGHRRHCHHIRLQFSHISGHGGIKLLIAVLVQHHTGQNLVDVLEPVINNWLYPEEDPLTVVFPEDREEMSPEDMLAENLPTESPSPSTYER